MGIGAGMGGGPLEMGLSCVHRRNPFYNDNSSDARMPGERQIPIAERSGAGHKHLAGQGLLGRAALKDDGARQILLLYFFLHTDGSADMGHSRQVMLAGMPRRPFLHRFFSLCIFRAHAREHIIFAQQSDDRPADAKACPERCGQTVIAALYLESFLLQKVRQKARCRMLRIRHFRLFPDLPERFVKTPHFSSMNLIAAVTDKLKSLFIQSCSNGSFHLWAALPFGRVWSCKGKTGTFSCCTCFR